MPSKTQIPPDFETLGRALDAIGPMPAALAHHILKFKVPAGQRNRLTELLARNGEGGMRKAELDELDELVLAGQWLAVLQALAQATKQPVKTRMAARA